MGQSAKHIKNRLGDNKDRKFTQLGIRRFLLVRQDVRKDGINRDIQQPGKRSKLRPCTRLYSPETRRKTRQGIRLGSVSTSQEVIGEAWRRRGTLRFLRR